ncbi:phosphoethanolamine transferase [Mariniflexile sp.]
MWFSKNKKEFSVELLFFIVIILSFLVDLFFEGFQIQRFLNLIENIFFAIILIIPLCFINSKKMSRLYFLSSFLFFNISVFIETSYYYIFKVNLSPSAIYIFFESNNGEAEEFVSFYLDIYLILYAALLTMLFVVVVSNRNIALKYISKTRFGSLKLIFGFILILILIRVTPLRFQNLPYLVLKSFYVVYFESKVLESDPYKSKKGIFEGAKMAEDTNSKLYVVVIGESTTRNNMSLYGYQRNTSPLLSNRNDLSVFNNVISAHAGTTASITKALSLENYEGSTKEKGSLVQLLNAVNFETYWISNQQPVGWAETDITKVAFTCKNKFYLSTESSEDTRSYDDVVFDKIDEVLKTNETNKFLFIHLQGSHIYYKNRYPDAYNIFRNKIDNSLIKKESDYDIVNEYDNAILYNDFVVNTIINKIQKEQKESFVLYFSDHGEEVFNTKKFVGHNDDVGTLPMYEIPYILWQSEKYKQSKKNDIDLNRPYMLDDLFHSIADLCGITSKYVDVERSIFNKSFKKRKRILLNNRDYDSLKKSKTTN